MSVLDGDALRRSLPSGWDLRHLHVLDQTGSTNDDLRVLAQDGAPHGTLVIANAQKRGRGRGVARWESPAGSGIWMSLLMRVAVPARVGGWVPLAVGVATAEALEDEIGVPIGLKWPNDLWVDGRKLGGVLVESSSKGAQFEWIIAGIGLNVSATPRLDGGGVPAISVVEAAAARRGAAARIERESLAAAVIARVLARVGSLDAPAGVEAIGDAFQARDVLANRQVRVLEDDGLTWDGRAAGVDESGGLRVAIEGSIPVIRSGSVRPIGRIGA